MRRVQTEEKEVRTIIARDFSASLINNTKWRELANTVAGIPLAYRVKWVDVAEPRMLGSFRTATDRYFDSSDFGPFLTLSIEWLDIGGKARPAHDSRWQAETDDWMAAVAERLRGIQVPFQQEGDFLRVTGHVRKHAGA